MECISVFDCVRELILEYFSILFFCVLDLQVLAHELTMGFLVEQIICSLGLGHPAYDEEAAFRRLVWCSLPGSIFGLKGPLLPDHGERSDAEHIVT